MATRAASIPLAGGPPSLAPRQTQSGPTPDRGAGPETCHRPRRRAALLLLVVAVVLQHEVSLRPHLAGLELHHPPVLPSPPDSPPPDGSVSSAHGGQHPPSSPVTVLRPNLLDSGWVPSYQIDRIIHSSDMRGPSTSSLPTNGHPVGLYPTGRVTGATDHRPVPAQKNQGRLLR
jgi:hypothetical protein